MKKIGILLDDLTIKSWQKKIIDYIEDHPLLNIEVLIINTNESSPLNSGFFYRFFQAADRKIFKVSKDAFASSEISQIKSTPILYIKGEETKFSYRFLEQDVDIIKKRELDVLIRFGFGILKGDILDAAKYGVWSLHHGDNKINRGGPPGFWEVVNAEEITGATLQRLSSDLDGGTVISKSYTKTDMTSFNRNKNEVFWSGVELFNSALDKLAKDHLRPHELEKFDNGRFYSKPLYKDPKNLLALKIHLKFWLRRTAEIIDEILNPPQWFLLYKFKKNNGIETSVFRYKKLIPPKGYDWADPFVIENDGDGIFLFFEELNIKSGRGHISYFKFNSSGELMENSPKRVIEEKFHLSYPFIFKENDTFYMIPESANSGELWLYKCLSFPDNWEKKKRIFSDKSFYDATLFKHNNYYYLFGTEKIIEENSRDQYLFIYYSTDLFGDNWEPHPSNPIYRDVRRARPAGKIFEWDGKLIRPSQIGAPKYGYGIQFNEILSLTPTEFKETKIEEILPDWDENLLATHTFNSVGGFTVLDAQGVINK